jgi:hypothetical protein
MEMDVATIPQAKADALMAVLKYLLEKAEIKFPMMGTSLLLDARSHDGRESFLFDVNRKGKIKVTKCTYQERYVGEVLMRLDIDGPPHENPDGALVPCPHLHVYREGYGDKWANPIDLTIFTSTADLAKTLRQFLTHCNVRDIPAIQRDINV